MKKKYVQLVSTTVAIVTFIGGTILWAMTPAKDYFFHIIDTAPSIGFVGALILMFVYPIPILAIAVHKLLSDNL